jgi:hypothetical protein
MYMRLGCNMVNSQESGESTKGFSIEDRPAPEARSRRAGGPTRSDAALGRCGLSLIRLGALLSIRAWRVGGTRY